MTGYGGHLATRFHSCEAAARAPRTPYALLDTVPAVDQQVWLRVAYPFAERADASFWALYEPPLVVLNGLSQDADEMRAMALVRCRLIELGPASGPYGQAQGVALARVENVIGIAELAGDAPGAHPIPASVWQQLYANPPRSRDEQIVRQHEFLFVDATERESDGGSWAIFERRGGECALLLFAQWGFHSDWFWAGKARLSAADASLLERLIAL